MNVLSSILVSLLLVSSVDKALDKEIYILASGKAVKAEVLEVNDSRVKMRVHVAGGSLERWFRLEEFKPHSAYVILRSVANAEDPGAHLRLAEFAANKSLIAVARRELHLARKLSGKISLGSNVQTMIDRRAVDGLERLFREALSKGQLDSAQKYLSAILIRHPSAKSAAEREALVALLDKQRLAAKDARHRAKAKRASARDEKRRESLLRTPRAHLAKGQAESRKGLLGSRHFASAHQHFTRAVRHFESTIRSMEVLERKKSSSDLLKRESRALRSEAQTGLANSLLNSGSLCLVRGKFTAAMEHVNRILLIDPKNSRALAMRARVEIAANQWGYGYGSGR
jgi:tetratricopeptide (TPR) repeat protein